MLLRAPDARLHCNDKPSSCSSAFPVCKEEAIRVSTCPCPFSDACLDWRVVFRNVYELNLCRLSTKNARFLGVCACVY